MLRFWHGPRELLNQGLAAVSGTGRDWELKAIDGRRSAIADIDLTFNNPPPRYDFSRDVVTFVGQALGSSIRCEISREALDDHFGTNGLDQKGRVEAFLKNRSGIELMARAKHLSWPIEEPGTVLIETMDVQQLLKEIG